MNADTSIELEHAGKVYRGTYCVEKGIVRVESLYGSKSTQAGPAPSAIARLLLGEIARADHTRESLQASKASDTNL